MIITSVFAECKQIPNCLAPFLHCRRVTGTIPLIQKPQVSQNTSRLPGALALPHSSLSYPAEPPSKLPDELRPDAKRNKSSASA